MSWNSIATPRVSPRCRLSRLKFPSTTILIQQLISLAEAARSIVCIFTACKPVLQSSILILFVSQRSAELHPYVNVSSSSLRKLGSLEGEYALTLRPSFSLSRLLVFNIDILNNHSLSHVVLRFEPVSLRHNCHHTLYPYFGQILRTV